MSSHSVGTQNDARTEDLLAEIAASEGYTPSQLVAAITRMLVELSPGARRALFSFYDCEAQERAFVARRLGRAALMARENIIASRARPEYAPATDSPLTTEAEIDAEAVAAARR